MAVATSRTVEPSGTAFVLPSGSVTVMSGMVWHLSDMQPPRRSGAARPSVFECSRYCLVLQYGQTCQFNFSALPHSTHGLRSFFMHDGQMR